MLPYLNYTGARAKKQMVAFRGLNWSDQTMDGELRDCLNLSARRFPYLCTRRGRQQMDAYEGATAMTARGSLVVVQGTDLIYDGQVVGQVMEGEKQFAVVNTRMVIWPDKVYLDLNTRKLSTLGASISGTGATFDAEKGTMTVTGWGDLTEKFRKNDGVTITGCANEANNITVLIQSVTATEINVGKNVFTTASETGTITVERRVPDMDFVCESENRLWGCHSASQTIYASTQGDPTNFFATKGASTDSYALAVGTEGDFTGCCKLGSSVLFWKETKLHKMLGSYPAEYTMYTYDIEGLQRGCHKSLQIINEVLYYQGLHGVYGYTGGLPSLVSEKFGSRSLTDGVAGTDGDSYYLSVTEGNTHHLLVYETTTGMWLREDGTRVVDFARVGKDMFFLDRTGKVWLADSGQEDKSLEWMAQFTPFYETAEGRKRFSKIVLRVEMPKGAWMVAEVKSDDGLWREAGKIIGQDIDTTPLRLPINRCDRFSVRLTGKGPCTIKAMMLEYSVGSDV